MEIVVIWRFGVEGLLNRSDSKPVRDELYED
jgi:hypothetical protein